MINYADASLFLQDSLDKQIHIVSEDNTINITNEDIVGESFTLTESLCSEENLIFGSCEPSCIKFTVKNTFPRMYKKWFNVTITLEGSETPFVVGTYRVWGEKPSSDRSTREITAYDVLYKIFKTTYKKWYKSLWDNTDSMTIKQFRDAWFARLEQTHSHISQETTNLVNDDVVIKKSTKITKPSGKDIFNAICEINGVFGRIGRDGVFHYVTLSNSNTAYSISKTQTIEVDYEDYSTTAIDRVEILDSEGEVLGQAGAEADNAENTYTIENNFMLKGLGNDNVAKDTGHMLALHLYNILHYITYVPFDAEFKGNPCFETGDKISFQAHSTTLTSFILERTMRGIQSLHDDYIAEGEGTYPETNNGFTHQIKELHNSIGMVSAELSQEISLKPDIYTNKPVSGGKSGDLTINFTDNTTDFVVPQRWADKDRVEYDEENGAILINFNDIYVGTHPIYGYSVCEDSIDTGWTPEGTTVETPYYFSFDAQFSDETIFGNEDLLGIGFGPLIRFVDEEHAPEYGEYYVDGMDGSWDAEKQIQSLFRDHASHHYEGVCYPRLFLQDHLSLAINLYGLDIRNVHEDPFVSRAQLRIRNMRIVRYINPQGVHVNDNGTWKKVPIIKDIESNLPGDTSGKNYEQIATVDDGKTLKGIYAPKVRTFSDGKSDYNWFSRYDKLLVGNKEYAINAPFSFINELKRGEVIAVRKEIFIASGESHVVDKNVYVPRIPTKSKAVIPIMTSNTTPSGTVSATNYTTGYEPWKAFDDAFETGWKPVLNTANPFLMYLFDSSIAPLMFDTLRVKFYSNSSSAINVNIVIKGVLSDQTSEVCAVGDTSSVRVDPNDYTEVLFDLNQKDYYGIRIELLFNGSDYTFYVNIAEVQLYTLVAISDGEYTLPIASANTLGGIKVGQNLSIDQNGVLNAQGGTTINALDDIGDVDITNPSNGQVLKYSNGDWVNGAESGAQAVELTQAQYDALSTEQKNDPTKVYYIIDAPSSDIGIDDLQNVNITNPTDGQIIEYDANSGKWVNVDNEGGGGGLNFSLIEQLVGKWIDDSDLYQLTVATGGNAPANTNLHYRMQMVDYDTLLYTYREATTHYADTFVTGSVADSVSEINCAFEPTHLLVVIPFLNGQLTYALYCKDISTTTSIWWIAPERGKQILTLGAPSGETGICDILQTGFKVRAHAWNVLGVTCKYSAWQLTNDNSYSGTFTTGSSADSVVDVNCGFMPDYIMVFLPFSPTSPTYAIYDVDIDDLSSLWMIYAENQVYKLTLGASSGETGICEITNNGFRFRAHGNNTLNVSCTFIACQK